MDILSLRLLAHSGALDEISNGQDGFAIENRIRESGSHGGHVRDDGVTGSAVLFIVYETGRHGPQNGFRVALVLEGVRVREARATLKRRVEEGAEELVVVGPDKVLSVNGYRAGFDLGGGWPSGCLFLDLQAVRVYGFDFRYL